MNIFILDTDTKKAAEYHCDKHVVKMILESAQMLSTSHWIKLLEKYGKNLSDFKRVKDAKAFLEENCSSEEKPPYKMTHVHHPCSIWTYQTSQNYNWHLSLLTELCSSYTERYKRIHKTSQYIKWFRSNMPYNISTDGLTEFPICMDEKYKVSNNPIECYRNYYLEGKSHFAKWKYTNTPGWYREGVYSI